LRIRCRKPGQDNRPLVRLAVVVGIGPGNGESLTRKFESEGYRVAMLTRSRDTLERYEAELVLRRDVTGEVEETGGGRFVLSSGERSPLWRAAAWVLLLFGLLGLALLVPAQRRWKRRERALGGQGTTPLRF